MSWHALPLVVYGYAVHPLSPSRRDTRVRSARLSPVLSVDELNREVVNLEVGDEVYAFEQYTPKGREVEGIWYRGYVVCTTRRPAVTWNISDDPSAITKSPKSDETQQVFIGIFPASHIFVRDKLPDAEGRLPELAAQAQQNGLPENDLNGQNGSLGSPISALTWNSARGMDPVEEEDQDSRMDTRSVAPSMVTMSRRSFRLDPPSHSQASSLRSAIPVYPASLRSVSPSLLTAQPEKPLPPRPSLKSGDETASGIGQPIIDEIASALREWHTLLFQYLARRDYKRFWVVTEHIEALHLGRRQLLAQALNKEESTNLRRDCVTRLVRGNLVQGLDVIVRHPLRGGLVQADVQPDVDKDSWVSTVRMYAMQVALAYVNVQYDDVASTLPGSAPPSATVPPSSAAAPTPSHSAFPTMPSTASAATTRHHSGPSQSSGSLTAEELFPSAAPKFYHIFLDVRAFVATSCAPGETTELFFSLWQKNGSSFVTEDYCTILNHNGMRTLFTDLAQNDIQDPIYLVCRIVRNGALKVGGDLTRRGSELNIIAPHSAAIDHGFAAPTSPQSPASRSGSSADYPAFARRPFGCAILDITPLARMATDQNDASLLREYTMPIFVPSSSELTFSTMHQQLITGSPTDFDKLKNATIAVSVKIFHGISSTVIRENMSLLQGIPHTLRLGFPDVVFPGDIRNELYVKLWSGEFGTHSTSGRIRSPRVNNVQVSVEVRDADGRAISSCISQGSGEPPLTHFHSMVFLKCNEPLYGELIKVHLPSTGTPQWHLFFTFRNRQSKERGAKGNGDEKPFAFAFQPLVPDTRTFLEDGSHNLVLYKADKIAQLHPSFYLSAPFEMGNAQRVEQLPVTPEFLKHHPFTRDTFMIRSSLCSTQFTQNAILLSLLNWEKLQDKELLSDILDKFTFVGESEIVKFLRKIFDSLFGILVSTINPSGEMDGLIFNAFVRVLGIVQDRRFSNFQPVLDVYIEKHFTCASASSHIIQSMNFLLANPTANETASSLRAALKVWHYIFKFVMKSRELQKAKEGAVGGEAMADHLDASFEREIRSHLSEVNRMMGTTSPASIIGTQTIALQHFTSILPELAKMFTTITLVSIATTFANAVAVGKGKSIAIWKLIMYLHIVKGFLFDNSQSRPLLVETVVLWIKPHLGRYDDFFPANETEAAKDAARVSWLENIRICVTIVAVMLDKLQENLVSPEISGDRHALKQERENVDNLLPLLPKLLESYQEFANPASLKAITQSKSNTPLRSHLPVTFPESYPFSLIADLPDAPKTATNSNPTSSTAFNTGLGETAVVLLSLLLTTTTDDIKSLLETVLDFEGKDRLVEGDAFPKSWLNVNILAHKVLIKLMDPIAGIMQKQFIPEQEAQTQFDATLWRQAFFMLLKLLSSDQLVIEEFSPQKRRAVWRLAGDIRGEGASVLSSLWHSLGWAEQLSPGGEHSTRIGGYQIYLNTLVGHVVDLCLSHHDQLRSNAVSILFSMIHELVTRLDSLFMSDSKGDDISRAFFMDQLRHHFEASDVDEELRERVAQFLDSVDLFLELLLSIRALPEGEEYADDRVIATLRLMNFIRRIGRDEIYIKYVHQLVNMHLNSQNYVEAALTLKLHADLHEWDLNTFLSPMEDLGLPQQSQFNRKETLCLLIMDYLGKGKAWERAIEICRELAYQHMESVLLERIVSDQRYYPDYYRVTFYGNFPTALRDKRFVYRGYEWEKFGAFCERMLNKHPGAQLLKSTGDPPVDLRFGQEQFIQCTAVTPEPDRNLVVFTNPDVPLPVRTYYEHSDVSVFSSSRQVRKTTSDGTEEVWTEKTYFTTEEKFPTVLRRSEVVHTEVIEISPIENALTDVEGKTKELAALNTKYSALAQTSQAVSTNALAMSLNSAVDTPLNTGVASYRLSFFGEDYVTRYPERSELVEQLKKAVDEQVRIIDSCLKLHGQLCPPEFLPFHRTLEKFFERNFKEEILRLDLDISASPSAASPVRVNGVVSQNFSGAREDRQLAPLTIPPLQLGRPELMSPSSPRSPGGSRPQSEMPQTAKTPLQRHLAHLARHGINAISAAPGEGIGAGSDSVSVNESPHTSFVNVQNGNGTSGSINNIKSAPMHSAASITTSALGSSLGSLKDRLSRFGSLHSWRRNSPSAS
ncbi:hypothetical protein DL96DRAFT_1602008 [Flagelloscypha sp. PMI_526]|nr:hypothetical protein DL96DRAFT_1602008 [Flagelloscypha sp. PMI_526]